MEYSSYNLTGVYTQSPASKINVVCSTKKEEILNTLDLSIPGYLLPYSHEHGKQDFLISCSR